MRNVKAFVISGPSGVGKDTIVNEVIGRIPELMLSISHTTRPKRPGEVDGKDYFFVDRENFEKMLKDEFLEHAEVHGHLYGTSIENLKRADKEGKHLVLVIDVQGARQVKKKLDNVVSIFIMPPSLDELRKRLKERNDTPNIENRLKKAEEELRASREYDFVVVNDKLEKSVEEVEKIIRKYI